LDTGLDGQDGEAGGGAGFQGLVGVSGFLARGGQLGAAAETRKNSPTGYKLRSG
jgi:hypothetical protein